MPRPLSTFLVARPALRLRTRLQRSFRGGLNDLRRQKNAATDAHADIDTIAPAYTADPESQLIAAEQAAAATAALAALAPHLREALLLHLAEGLTQPEVAERLGCSRRTVQRYITQALAQLHLALADPDSAL